MPLGRYFIYVGGFLLALILGIDWYLPQQPAEASRADVDRSTIRIHSVHKWPSAVVFDTTQPTIVPPQPVQAETVKPPPREKSPREALALAREVDAVAAPPAPAKNVKRRARIARVPAARVASSDVFEFRPFLQPGW